MITRSGDAGLPDPGGDEAADERGQKVEQGHERGACGCAKSRPDDQRRLQSGDRGGGERQCPGQSHTQDSVLQAGEHARLEQKRRRRFCRGICRGESGSAGTRESRFLRHQQPDKLARRQGR